MPFDRFLYLHNGKLIMSQQSAQGLSIITHWRDYYELCKPRVVALIVFTAVIGMFLAVNDLAFMRSSEFITLAIYGTLGIGMAASSAAAINQIVEQKVDAEMKRTEGRPLPTGHITNRQALIFATLLGVTSMLILYLLVNVLTAVLTFLSLIGYAFIYTLYLKRATPQNIVIGGAAGAAPPVLGWAAITDAAPIESWLLFLIIFIWTPPHFWALAIAKVEDYAKVNIPMLPVTHGVEYTRLQVLLYAVLLLLVTLLPFMIGMNGIIYLVGAVILGAIFIYYAVKMQNPDNTAYPMKTFGFSILYLMLLFALLLIDHYLILVTLSH